MALGVEGVRVGMWTDPGHHTGCTVILPPAGTVGGIAVRGGAPGTREAAVLGPTAPGVFGPSRSPAQKGERQPRKPPFLSFRLAAGTGGQQTIVARRYNERGPRRLRYNLSNRRIGFTLHPKVSYMEI